ncbi:membrane fusion protein (multidrug efflux system) [Mucilaginibacter gracilis]|uniref:Membrane fusion protein (Multidrug efflux system) n=1 Tax=Mucilaginibacter gracilis TaxID=423350 RepID=A0A495J213_9SPHI|nr:efflux RND transporter periplasmic adaptor subunit [Mucilaginibacter gracilis]RKR83016.1 membrane fusion protein (multidrug efflux system) [Mucilaginibacter gracilis]
MNKRYIFLIGPVAMLMWVSCKQAPKQITALPPTAVTLVSAEKGNAIYYDQYPGVVVPLNSVELRSQVAGYLTGIFFKEGDVVEKGKPLYEIDRRKYQSAYLQAQANLSSAQANLIRSQKDADRYNQLLKQDAVAKQLVDNATATLASSQSQVESAKAGVVSAKTDLDYSLIRAPFTGRIGISQVKLGAQVSPGTTLLNTISSEDPIAVDFVVDEKDIPRFAAMQSKPAIKADSTFMLSSSTGVAYKQPGKILVIDRGVDNQSGTIKVGIQFPNPKKELISGMSVVLKVLNQQSGVQVLIPYKAITEQMGEFFVFVSQNDTIAVQHKVQVGPRVSDKIVIMSGINEGDKVVTEGLNRLRDKGKIQVGPPKQSAQGQQQAPK